MSYTTARDLRKLVPCFGTHDEKNTLCTVECDARVECLKEKELYAIKIGAPIAKQKTSSPEEMHKAFIDAMTEIFPRAMPTVFPSKGVQHEFFNGSGAKRCLTKTVLADYSVRVIFEFGNGQFNFTKEVFQSPEDVQDTVDKIKGIIKQHG